MLVKVELRFYLNKVVFLGPFTVHMYKYILQIIFSATQSNRSKDVINNSEFKCIHSQYIVF